MSTNGSVPFGSTWRKPASLPSYSRQFANGWTHGPHIADSFFIPSYLRNSRYIIKLERAHKERVANQREPQSSHSSNAPSLSTSASNVNLHRIPSSYRGITYDVIERTPSQDEEGLTPLPSRWNENDKYVNLDILQDGSEMRYNGPNNKLEHEAAAARTDHSISPQCGIYYYEVTIMSKTKDGMIAVGVSGQKASLERLPGWETDSWAYHGDDGKAFGGESTGKNYGPTFSTNNVIGCGVNFSTGCIFFTKDGNFLGNAFRELKDLKVFPSVGMKKHAGAHIAANFGQSPFVFNINEMVAEEQRKIEMAINRTNTSSLHPLVDEDKFIQDLVAQFLAHDGYVETARAFAKDRRAQNTALTHINQEASQDVEVEDDIDAINRQRVRVAIMEGDIDKALKLTNAFYPHVLEESPQIVFRLKCRKFVELIRRYSDLQYKTSGKMGKASNRANGVSDVFEQDMELDDQTDSAAWDGMDTDDTDHLRMALLQEAMAYGQILQREYRDERREFKKALEDIFSLMAYDDAKASLHGHLLDSSGRVPVAEELNSAILVSLGKASSAALERVYQQCEALVDEISEDGGAGAFVNVENNFLG